MTVSKQEIQKSSEASPGNVAGATGHVYTYYVDSDVYTEIKTVLYS